MKMKRNTYTVEREGKNMIALVAYLGVRSAKKFDHGLAFRKHNDLFKWKGLYSKTKEGWSLFIQRCAELEALGVQRNYEAEQNSFK